MLLCAVSLLMLTPCVGNAEPARPSVIVEQSKADAQSQADATIAVRVQGGEHPDPLRIALIDALSLRLADTPLVIAAWQQTGGSAWMIDVTYAIEAMTLVLRSRDGTELSRHVVEAGGWQINDKARALSLLVIEGLSPLLPELVSVAAPKSPALGLDEAPAPTPPPIVNVAPYRVALALGQDWIVPKHRTVIGGLAAEYHRGSWYGRAQLRFGAQGHQARGRGFDIRVFHSRGSLAAGWVYDLPWAQASAELHLGLRWAHVMSDGSYVIAKQTEFFSPGAGGALAIARSWKNLALAVRAESLHWLAWQRLHIGDDAVLNLGRATMAICVEGQWQF